MSKLYGISMPFYRPIKLFLSVSVFLSTSSVVLAQSDYRPGSIVIEGDTISGWIDYRSNSRNNEVCSFKPTEQGQTYEHTTRNITAYWFHNDKHYESKFLPLNKTDSVLAFAEIVLNGEVSLLLYKDRFFVEKGTKIYLLEATTKEVDVEGRTMIRDNDEFKGILNFLVGDCGDLRPEISSLSLSQKPLTRILEKYHKCISAPYIVYQASKPWTKVTTGFIGGFNHSSLKFTAARPVEYLTAADFTSDIQPTGGAFIDLSSPRINERVSLVIELWYQKHLQQGFSEVGTSTNDIIIKYSTFKVPISFRYTFPEKSVTPYFNIGIANSFISQGEIKRILERRFGDQIFTSESEPIPIRNAQFAVLGGIGGYRKITPSVDIFLEARFEIGSTIVGQGLLAAENLNSRTTTIGIFTGLRF